MLNELRLTAQLTKELTSFGNIVSIKHQVKKNYCVLHFLLGKTTPLIPSIGYRQSLLSSDASGLHLLDIVGRDLSIILDHYSRFFKLANLKSAARHYSSA